MFALHMHIVIIIQFLEIHNRKQYLFIAVSQESIRALGSNVMNFRTVYGCRKHLNKVAKMYDVHLGSGTQ